MTETPATLELQKAAIDYAIEQGYALPAPVVVPPPVVTPPPVVVTPPPVVVTPPAGPTPPVNPLGTPRSGLSWHSGIWGLARSGSAASYTASIKAAETARGRKSDTNMAAQYNNGAWGDLTGLQIVDFLDDYDNQAGGPVTVIMLPPFVPGGTWTAAKAGTYDTYYTQIGQALAAKRPNLKTVIRFAWEENGNWYPWSIISAGGVADFEAGWARAVTKIRAGAGAQAANILFNYSLSGLDSYAGDPLTVTYPGDAYVDILGLDIYDRDNVTTSDTVPGWNANLNRALAFVQNHGKLLAFDEWGLNHSSGTGFAKGNDNPHFINAMFTWFKTNKAWLAYESYFQDDDLGNVNSSLFSTAVNNNPNSKAAYLAVIKAGG